VKTLKTELEAECIFLLQGLKFDSWYSRWSATLSL